MKLQLVVELLKESNYYGLTAVLRLAYGTANALYLYF